MKGIAKKHHTTRAHCRGTWIPMNPSCCTAAGGFTPNFILALTVYFALLCTNVSQGEPHELHGKSMIVANLGETFQIQSNRVTNERRFSSNYVSPEDFTTFEITHGSRLSFNSLSVDEQLVLFGAGSVPDNSFSNRHEYKSPTTAFLIGFFPGFVIHGLGHHYADQHLIGFGLLGVEVAGYFLFVDDLKNNGFFRSEDNYTQTYIGLGLFLGSWVFDFVRSPIVVSKQNKRQTTQTGFHPELKLAPQESHVSLRLTYTFK